MTDIFDKPVPEDFQQYTIMPVADEREVHDQDCDVSYCVIGHNGMTATNSSWEMRDMKVLFTTELGDYDGAFHACKAFIVGYKAALPPRRMSFVGSSA